MLRYRKKHEYKTHYQYKTQSAELDTEITKMLE